MRSASWKSVAFLGIAISLSLLAAEQPTLVGEELWIDFMARDAPQLPLCRPVGTPYQSIVTDRDRSTIEPDVIVRTQTQNIARDVRAIMRPSQRSDVGNLSVFTSGGGHNRATDLASMPVQLLHALRDHRVSDYALNRGFDPIGDVATFPGMECGRQAP